MAGAHRVRERGDAEIFRDTLFGGFRERQELCALAQKSDFYDRAQTQIPGPSRPFPDYGPYRVPPGSVIGGRVALATNQPRGENGIAATYPSAAIPPPRNRQPVVRKVTGNQKGVPEGKMRSGGA